MTMNRSGRPTKRELETATKTRKLLAKRVENILAWGNPVPVKLSRELVSALQHETALEMRRRR